MSLVFKPPAKDRHLDPELVKCMLNENALLIEIITEYQNKGKVHQCLKYQDILTRNLLYLSGVSDFQADEDFKPRQALKNKKSHDVEQNSIEPMQQKQNDIKQE